MEGYYQKISKAFVHLRAADASNGKYTPEILFDGANGVGALAVEEFVGQIGSALNITRYNKGDGTLNHMCGADFVKVSMPDFDSTVSVLLTFVYWRRIVFIYMHFVI